MAGRYDICFASIMMPQGSIYKKNIKGQGRSNNITYIQQALLDGINKINDEKAWIINTPLVPLFPRGYKKPIVRSSMQENGVNHGFINLRGLYSSSLYLGSKKHLKKWAKKQTEKEKVFIAYSLTSYTLKAINLIKSIDKSIKTIIIVPDLPQYTFRETKNFLSRLKNSISKRIVNNHLNRFSKNVDGWLLFSKKMIEELPNCNKYMVFEGLSTDSFENVDSKRVTNSEDKEIVYVGGLHKNYGVALLLEAMSFLPREYKLLLAGRGDLEERIKKLANEDDRIKYLGAITREEVIAIEKGANVLVNPRTNCGIFTRYSFPSKNMEYLSSGVPCVCFKLEGVPDEYDKYFNYCPEETGRSLAETIKQICDNQDEFYVNKAREGREFVNRQKNKVTWAENILDFIKKL